MCKIVKDGYYFVDGKELLIKENNAYHLIDNNEWAQTREDATSYLDVATALGLIIGRVEYLGPL